MAIHLIREIDKLKKMILSLAALVEESVNRAVKAVAERDLNLAQLVIESDHEIDKVEVDVEEECLKILALHQPVANDLRFIIAMLKINHDLERIGDLAVSVGERASTLAGLPRPDVDFDLLAMADKVQSMVAHSIDALINKDLTLARRIWMEDDEIDNMNRAMYQQVMQAIRKNPGQLDALLNVLSVARNLERIADHATNIAKDVIYLIQGDIVRHRSREYKADAAATAGRPAAGSPPA
jgi:phosphate transport system protein